MRGVLTEFRSDNTANDMPLISVIVPVYNVDKYLERCIDSILGQSYKQIEIILVDDGSSDRSGKICDSYARSDFRVRVIHKENGGLSSARNRGIDMAQGEYLVFVDSDDYVEKDYVKILLNLIIKYDVDMSVVGQRIVNSRREIKKNNSRIIEEKRLAVVEALDSILTEKYFTVSANGKLYKRVLFDGARYPEGKLYEDNGCTYKLIMKCNAVAYSNVELYHYCMRCDSITNRVFNDGKFDYIELTDEACKKISRQYPVLKRQCLYRMAMVRVSILRQMLNTNLDKRHRREKNKIKKWLKSNMRQLIFGKGSPKKLRLSIVALIVSEKLLKLVGIVYEKNK